MHLVIGGAYQGKKEYVKKKYSIEESDIWQGGYPVAGGQWRCINGLHKIIEQMLYQYEANCICEVKEDEKVPIGSAANSVQQKESYVNKTLEYLSTMIERNPDLIFICDEVGNGIVPVEKEERDYRECVGRVLCVLAEEADTVERVHCGIPQTIKNIVNTGVGEHHCCFVCLHGGNDILVFPCNIDHLDVLQIYGRILGIILQPADDHIICKDLFFHKEFLQKRIITATVCNCRSH